MSWNHDTAARNTQCKQNESILFLKNSLFIFVLRILELSYKSLYLSEQSRSVSLRYWCLELDPRLNVIILNGQLLPACQRALHERYFMDHWYHETQYYLWEILVNNKLSPLSTSTLAFTRHIQGVPKVRSSTLQAFILFCIDSSYSLLINTFTKTIQFNALVTYGFKYTRFFFIFRLKDKITNHALENFPPFFRISQPPLALNSLSGFLLFGL